MLNFPYTASKGAIPFTIQGVNCAIDCIEVTPTELRFGVLEITSPGIAQWMGINAGTVGSPVWVIETSQSPIGAMALANPNHDPAQPAMGLALDYINALGAKLLTAFIPALNAQLQARFPAIPVPVATSPPFTDEPSAVAYLQGQLPLRLKVVNGVVSAV